MIPYTTIPFVSALFLVFVGMLIGQLFWSQFKSHHQRVIDKLRVKVNQQRSELRKYAATLTELGSEATTVSQRCDTQATEMQQLLNQFSALQSTNLELTERLAQESQARKDLAACLADERQQRRAEVEQLRESVVQSESRRDLTEQANREFKDHLERCETELHVARQECERLRVQLREQSEYAVICQREQQEFQHQAEETHQKSQLLRDRITQLEELNECTHTELEGLRAQQQTLLQQLAHETQSAHQLGNDNEVLLKQLEQSKLNSEEFRIALKEAEDRRQLLEQELDDVYSQLETARADASAAHEHLAELRSVDASVKEKLRLTQADAAHLEAQLTLTTRELDQLKRSVAEKDKRLADADKYREEVAQLSQTIAEQKQRLASMAERGNEMEKLVGVGSVTQQHLKNQLETRVKAHENTIAELGEARKKVCQLEKSVEQIRSQLDVAAKEVTRLQTVDDQIIEIDAERRQLKDELKQVKRERDAAREVEVSTREIVSELREELNERLDSIEVLRRERESTTSQLEFEFRRRGQLEDALEQAESRLAKAQSECDAWSQRHAGMLARNAELTEQLQQWQAKARESVQSFQDAEDQIAELAAQLKREQEASRRTRPRLFGENDSEKQMNSRGQLSFRGLRSRETQPTADAEIGLAIDPKLGKVYQQPPQLRDDLKKIDGIAEALEKQLHQLGIYTYRQVMEWDQTAIAEITRRLGLGDLIQSHDWVGQARQLFEQGERNVA